VGSFISDISRQLTKILKEESEDSELARRFRVHPQYDYSPKLEVVLAALRLGSSLKTWGPEYINQITPGLHSVANNRRERFSDEEREYLRNVASRLTYSSSF